MGSPLDLEPFRRKSREDLVKLLNEFRKCFKEDVPNQLMEDLDVIRKLRNAYAHRTTPTQHIFSRNEHKMILKALRETWMDLRNEYDKFVSC